MRKDLKNRVPVSSAIDRDLFNWLTLVSLETDIPKSKLLDRAIRLLQKEMECSNAEGKGESE